MDALKNAGRAMIKSPGVTRHAWGTSKHQKLAENWTDAEETLAEGVAFRLKYLGMTLVGQPKGEEMAAAAVRRILATARAGAKKSRKITLTVSPKGIVITDTDTADLLENVSIYRISYCTADKSQDKVFAYVSQSPFNETLECHAFLCQKKKIAQAVTLTVAQAFKVALDLWEIAQQDKSSKARSACCACAAGSNGHTGATDSPCLPAAGSSASSGCASSGCAAPSAAPRRPSLSLSLSASVSSPSPRNDRLRRAAVKHDSRDADGGPDEQAARDPNNGGVCFRPIPRSSADVEEPCGACHCHPIISIVIISISSIVSSSSSSPSHHHHHLYPTINIISVIVMSTIFLPISPSSPESSRHHHSQLILIFAPSSTPSHHHRFLTQPSKD